MTDETIKALTEQVKRLADAVERLQSSPQVVHHHHQPAPQYSGHWYGGHGAGQPYVPPYQTTCGGRQ